MIVLETLARRWYAFGFVALLVCSVLPHGGWRRAARFVLIAFVVQLAAELSSTRNGFPFGRYDYVAPTRGEELYVSNVPLFVPISFGSVVWAGRALARAIAPGARGAALALGGAACAAILDLAIDPMTMRGDQWFLGRLYAYRGDGAFFGVPWTNFAGWVLASAVILLADHLASRREPEPPAHAPRSLALPATILAFFLALSVATRHWLVAVSVAGIAAGFALAGFARRPVEPSQA